MEDEAPNALEFVAKVSALTKARNDLGAWQHVSLQLTPACLRSGWRLAKRRLQPLRARLPRRRQRLRRRSVRLKQRKRVSLSGWQTPPNIPPKWPSSKRCWRSAPPRRSRWRQGARRARACLPMRPARWRASEQPSWRAAPPSKQRTSQPLWLRSTRGRLRRLTRCRARRRHCRSERASCVRRPRAPKTTRAPQRSATASSPPRAPVRTAAIRRLGAFACRDAFAACFSRRLTPASSASRQRRRRGAGGGGAGGGARGA
jgi:hypothetical protein